MKNLIQAEFRKLFYLRSSSVYLLTLLGLSLAMGLIFALTTNATQGKAITALSPMDVLSAHMLGVDAANVMLILFVAASISKEFSAKLIHVSLAVTPDRKKFFLGKVITFFILSVAVSVLATSLNYLASQVILAANQMPAVSLQDAAARQFIAGVVMMPVFYAVITAAAAFLFSSGAGAAAFALGVMALPALVKMFSDPVQHVLLPIFPQSAIHSLSGIANEASAESMGIVESAVLLSAWIAATLLAAYLKFRKQDL